MLTVLHRDADGSETIYEASSIRRCQPEDTQCIPALGRFELYGVSAPDIPSGAQIWLNIEPPFGAIFVMNRFGATVARYLAEPGPGRLPTRAEDAVPEAKGALLAA